jgi:hypothetical protein
MILADENFALLRIERAGRTPRWAADDQRVAPCQQILDHGDSVADLGSPEDRDVRMRRVVSGAA